MEDTDNPFPKEKILFVQKKKKKRWMLKNTYIAELETVSSLSDLLLSHLKLVPCFQCYHTFHPNASIS